MEATKCVCGNRAILRSPDDSSALCGTRFGLLARNLFAGTPYPNEIQLENVSFWYPTEASESEGLGTSPSATNPGLSRRRVNAAGHIFAAAPLGGDAPHFCGHVTTKAEPPPHWPIGNGSGVPGLEETASGRGLPDHGASDHSEEDEAERARAAAAHAVSSER